MNVNLDSVNFEVICRICLKIQTCLNSLFQTDAADMLKFCGFLEVDQSDELPDKICTDCNNILLESYKLKQLCISSKLYLQTALEARDNIDTVDIGDEFNRRLENEEINEQFMLYECAEQVVSEKHWCNSVQDIQDLEDGDSNKVHPSSVGECEPKSDVKYQCLYCEITFEHEQDLFVHKSIHRGDGHKCNICKKKCDTMKILKRHLKTHMIFKSHICKICNKGFAEASAVVKHEKRSHLGIPREKNYKCEECGQRFTDHYYLKVHQRKHSGEKPLKCDVCEKPFYDPRSLKVHLDAHKGIKPYLCSYCGKSFTQNAHLKQHIIVHSAEKPHCCKVCSKRFTQSTSLQRHQKVHLATHKFSRLNQLFHHKKDEHDIQKNAMKSFI